MTTETGINIHTTAGKLADLERRVDEAVHAGSARAVEKQHARGKKTARERIEMLLDEGSFVELDELARHRSTNFGLERNRPYGDGVVTGYGTVDGRQVCVFAQDFTVFGGSLGEVFGEKIVKVMDLAMKIGCPVIGINDSGGARIQEGVVSLGLYGEIFFRNVRASGVIPQISLVMGPCAGGAVYSPAVTDFTVMVDQTSHMFITGPDVIKTVTGEDVGMEELGGARTHNTAQRQRALPRHRRGRRDRLRQGAAVLPAVEQPRRAAGLRRAAPTSTITDEDRELDTLIPDSANQPYDMHRVIEHVLDDGEFLEVQPLYAQNIVVGFGRVEGRPVGVVANQPMHFAGTPRHRRLGEGRPVRAHLRRVQHPGADLRGRARLPARHRPGVGRHHPPRRQAHLRVRRGDRPEGHRDHPQGVRRGVRRHGLQAPRRGPELRLADRADRGDGRAGRGEHPLPLRAGRTPTTRPPSGPRRSPSTRTPWPTRTSPPSAATSTR